jgi:quinol monooxygenase YgiN
MTYAVIGEITARPGRREELVAHLLQVAAALPDRPGNLNNLVATSDDPNSVWTWEVWVNREAHDAYLAGATTKPEILATATAAQALIASMAPTQQLTIRGGTSLTD